MTDDLQQQVDKLSNQARFVQMIVNKELSVSNRKKVDIVTELRKRDFKSFPKKAKARAAGETEPSVEDDTLNDNGDNDDVVATGSTDFDYLLGMPIWNLTKEKVCLTHWHRRYAYSPADR